MKSRVLNFYMACCLSLMHAILISLYDCSEEEGRTRTKVVPSPTVSIRIQRLVGGCYSVALKFVFPLLWCAFIHWWSSLVHSVICLRISVIQRKGDQICHHNQKVHEAMTHFMNGVWSFSRTNFHISKGSSKRLQWWGDPASSLKSFPRSHGTGVSLNFEFEGGWAEIGMVCLQAVKH